MLCSFCNIDKIVNRFVCTAVTKQLSPNQVRPFVPKDGSDLEVFNARIQLFRRLSEKVHATTPKGIVGSFECPVLQRNLKELHGRPRTYVCECQRKVKKLVSTATVVRNSVLIISNIIFLDCSVHIFSDNLSRNSCIRMYFLCFIPAF